MAKRTKLSKSIVVGDVVQIDPQHDDVFGACFMVVTELKPTWDGLMGYVTAPGRGNAFYRVPCDKVTRIGRAEWALPTREP